VYRNETIQDLYEPGSVMKSITMAIGIDTGEISPYDYYKDDGFVMIDKFKIKNSTAKCL
jgi:cell division protein FtsI/penicillin-binding protein 2